MTLTLLAAAGCGLRDTVPPDGQDARPVLSTDGPTAPEPSVDLTEPSPDEALTDAVTPEPPEPEPSEQAPAAPAEEEQERAEPRDQSVPDTDRAVPETACDIGDRSLGDFVGDVCEEILSGFGQD
ncbi:hypothetical protein [Streptomyces specialis]|uniref:hypothetical protein n=1 Tax=Streptomyces specialis TaxID=498367 RepID=UPI00131D8792|nr:hypothetical protein [Streptomyces specialis]